MEIRNLYSQIVNLKILLLRCLNTPDCANEKSTTLNEHRGAYVHMPNGADLYTLSGQERETVKGKLEVLQKPAIIKVNLTTNPRSDQFRKFIDGLAFASDKLQPLYITHDEDGPPAIELRPNLHYLALPVGRELAPFLQSLVSYSRGQTALKGRSLSVLEGFITPTKVEVFMSLQCPHCPSVVGLVNQMALANKYLEVSIVDVISFPDLARQYAVRAVPTVVIDGQNRLTGDISEEILVDNLTNRDPSTFHPETLKRILKGGDAERLAGMMVAESDLYSGALDLLSDSDWSVRMGIMVVLESVAERSPDLVRNGYPYLLKLLDHQDPNQRGDAAYLLGLIGDASVLAGLEMLFRDENPEVAEVAREAVEQIKERQALGK